MKVRVKLYKTVNGRDTLRAELEFGSMAKAIATAEEWEARSIDNYAVFS